MSQNSAVIWRRSADEPGAGPRSLAAASNSGGPGRTAQRLYRDEQSPAMADQGDAEFPEVVAGEMRQDICRNVVFGEYLGVLLQADLS